MVSPEDKQDVALIIGPTASGKSALALELAKKQDSVVINADSAQVYRDLQILSARPTEAEMEGIEHQLYGYIDGVEACSAAKWAEDAKIAIKQAHNAAKLPILAGGTGLYVRTLLEGISPIPEINQKIRDEVRELEVLESHKALLAEDPISAARLNPTDTMRVQRALEVVRSTGQTLNHWHQHKSGGIGDTINLKAAVLLPPRDWLYERCDHRFSMMLDAGAIDEVKSLLDRDLPDDRPVMRAIGVPEIAAMMSGETSRETAIEKAQTATRRYAKRQYTWFRNQSPASWRQFNREINNDNITDIVTLFQ